MKFPITLFLSSVLCGCMISCKKNNDTPATIPLFEVTIDGNYWKADSVVAIRYPENVSSLYAQFRISAFAKDNKAFYLSTSSDTVSSLNFFSATLANFRAYRDVSVNNYITLKWETSTEENTDKFIIERSFNTVDFVKVGEVKAAGNSSNTIKYSWSEKPPINDPFDSRCYYRLKILDKDGLYEYSFVIVIKSGSPVLYTFSGNNYSYGFDGNISVTTVDKDKRLISGTFYFSCIDDVSGEKIEMKKG